MESDATIHIIYLFDLIRHIDTFSQKLMRGGFSAGWYDRMQAEYTIQSVEIGKNRQKPKEMKKEMKE